MRNTSTPHQHQGASAGPTPFLIYVEFFLTGVVTVLLGPILPSLRTHFGISNAQAGTLFVAQFTASCAGAMFSLISARFSITFGLLLIASGTAALPFGSWRQAHVAVGLFGLGLGLVIPATNMYVAYARGRDRATALNIINFVWGIGAATAPLLIGLLRRFAGLNTILLLTAASVASVFLLLLIFPLPHTGLHNERPGSPGASPGLLPLVIFCAMLFLYVGAETAIGGWTAAYVHEISARASWETVALFCFWLALLGGRAVAPLTLRMISESRLYRVSLFIAATGIIVLIGARTAQAATMSAFIAGAGFAPLYALTVALLSRHAESRGTGVPGWVFSIGGMGAAAVPWLVGTVATRFNSLRRGLLLTLAACTLLFILHLWQPDSPARRSDLVDAP